MTGVVILAAALVAALAFGLYRRRVDGRFAAPEVEEVAQQPSRDRVTEWSTVLDAVPTAVPGERATLVQFSSAFCAPCRTTRVLLADVASQFADVSHVEIDAEEHLALVRELDIRRTPTTLILGADGKELTRAAGAPRREQVLAALPASQESR